MPRAGSTTRAVLEGNVSSQNFPVCLTHPIDHMVCVPKSTKEKGWDALRARSAQLEKALKVWKLEQLKPAESRLSARNISWEYGVPVSTLHDHINKKHERQAVYLEGRQLLNGRQESELVEVIQALDRWDVPPSGDDIEGMANEILNCGHRAGRKTVGKGWLERFVIRKAPQITSRWASPLDKKRTDGLNIMTWKQHFDLVRESNEEYDIAQELDYGFDESPMMLGIGSKRRVFGRRQNTSGKRVRQSYERRDGNRESLTVTEFICGDGTVGKPVIIMRGKSLKKEWGGRDKNPIDAMFVTYFLCVSLRRPTHSQIIRICCSAKGSTDNELTLEWLKFFDKQTKEKAGGRYRRIFLDGHKSHCTLAFIKYARANHIILICYPPHCTHALQGLDVVLFSRIKALWSELLRSLIRLDEKVTKFNFLIHYATIRDRAFTKENIFAAWRVTGIWPFNPNVIEPEQLAPAMQSSVETTELVKLPKELDDIREALNVRNTMRRIRETTNLAIIEEEGEEPTTVLSTPKRVSTHIRSAVTGTAYEYISNPATDLFSTSIPPPNIHMTPVHHRNPQHPSFFLPPPSREIDSPSIKDAQHYLRLALAHISYQSNKIDRHPGNSAPLFPPICQCGTSEIVLQREKEKTYRHSTACCKRQAEHDI